MRSPAAVKELVAHQPLHASSCSSYSHQGSEGDSLCLVVQLKDAAPASTGFKRRDPVFTVPSTKARVNAALLVEPFHRLSATARQGKSALRHASVTSSQVRQRKSPYDVPPSTRNAAVITPVSPRSGLPQEESAHRLGEAEPLTPDDVLGCASTGSSSHAAHASAHDGVAGAVAERVHGAEIAHGEGRPAASVVSSPSQHLSRTSPLALAGAVPSPSSRQASPSAVRARLTYASAQDDGCFGRLSSRFCAEEAQQQQLLLVAQRCHLIQREEAAAREWLVLDASVQRHHIVCGERAAYRLAKSQQDHRRLPDASAYSVAGADAFGNASAPDEGDGENQLRSFSLSTSLPRLADHRNEDSSPHDQDAPASLEEVHRHAAEKKSNSGEKDEAFGDAAEEAQEEPGFSMRPSEVNQWTTSPPRALPPSSPSEGLEGELLARICDLHNEEEDQRFLLTGDCPPPDVFQRWADRYFEDKRVCFSAAAPSAGHSSAVRAALSPEATERCCSRSDSPAIVPPTYDGAAFIALAPSGSALARIPAAASHDPSRSPLLSATAEGEAKQADEEFLRREGASASWHRLCSEHRRAWAMENFLGTDDTYANYQEGRSAGSARSPLPSSRGQSEFNASGRCAPDPRIFGAGRSAAPQSAFLPPSHAASSSSAPRPTRIEGAAARAKSDFLQQPPKPATTDSSLLRKMACPTEKTYSAPLGSEREAWQALMDAFIDGLLQIMGSE
ncbi:hypothetical protein CGC21_37480 [Leishmania donovani]|uniref:Uncharacterized protein n=1 Tax=Leishmania donovani TaxID=5661 RepID=A0A504Y0G3_LEIDO|nr:hypothetical protein CGC21_37480 [Leishmania donovani]